MSFGDESTLVTSSGGTRMQSCRKMNGIIFYARLLMALYVFLLV